MIYETEDELTISARMAEEMIDVWNKYICEIYGEPEVQNERSDS